MLLLLGIVLLLLLPSPWALVSFAVCLVLGLGELLFWRRRVKNVPEASGPDTLIGKEARVVSQCRPLGQVELGGEIWSAKCEGGADAGEVVMVIERDGLELRVRPRPREPGEASSQPPRSP